MVRQVAARLAQILRVQLLHHGVLVALAQGHGLIFAIQGRRAQGTQIGEIAHIAALMGLAAAVDSPAGAGHHFHKVILRLAALDAV